MAALEQQHVPASIEGAGNAGTSRRPQSKFLDLALCGTFLVLGAIAVSFLPERSAARIVLGLPVLFFIPGFLLLEALLGLASTSAQRLVRSVAAIGISPAIVGLLALATAILPGGFRPLPIVLFVTAASLGFAGAAYLRRRSGSTRAAAASPVTA